MNRDCSLVFMIIQVFTGLFLPAFYSSTHGNAIKKINIFSRQFPRNLIIQNFLHGQGVMTLWLRLKKDSISCNASEV